MKPETVTEHMVDSNLDYYQQWQVNKYGNIVASTGELLTHDEVVEIETEKMLEKLNADFELQLDDHWNY